MGWEKNGISGRGDYPIKGINYSGPIVILGSSYTLWDDIKRARLLYPLNNFMAINFSGIHFREPIQHWATLHHDKMKHWVALKRFDYAPHITTHSHKYDEGIDFVWDFENVGGTSSLFATRVCLALGYTKVVLCGVTIDSSPCFFDPPWHHYNYDTQPFRLSWFHEKETYFRDRVRSMSGRTRDWLGEPTKEWLNG